MPQRKYTLEHTDTVLVNVHTSDLCYGRSCPMHGKTDHSMRSFPQHFRGDRGMMERICPHGFGHPDPDDLPFQIERQGRLAAITHGCDGCCAP